MRATGAKKLKISKPYFQISINFENPQNPSCMIWKSILKNLKNLNLEVAGGLSPRWVPTRKKTFFFLIRTSRVFFEKSSIFFAKIRSSRDLFKNEVLDQNFDFGSSHTPLTLGNFQNFDKFPLISHCKLH